MKEEIDELSISQRTGTDIFLETARNGEEYRRAYTTKPWKSDYEIYEQPSPEPEPTGDRYLTFTANEDNVQLCFFVETLPGFTPPQYTYDMWFSLDDGDTWEPYNINFGLADPQIIELRTGESVMFKGVNNIGFTGENYWVRFGSEGGVSASGDITSILNGIGGDCELPENCYQKMFGECTGLTTAPNLPSTTLANSCYRGMFSHCINLTTAPELPATTLAESCYRGMFSDCTSLTTAPELPATTLAESCYRGMFINCTSLTTAPELPATELVSNCYGYYFSGQFSLDEGMFSGCTSLNYVKAMFLTEPSSEYTAHWLYDVSQTGTFVKNPAAKWIVPGANGIPIGWTVITADA